MRRKPQWTQEEESSIRAAVDEYQRARREEKLDAEIRRCIYKSEYGNKAALYRFLAMLRRN
jgi:hypothetical protein